MNNIKQILAELVNTINKTEHIEKIILFGSRARDDAEERSDIDIAIVCPKITDREWLDLCERIEDTDTLLEINVIKFDSAGKELQNKILEEGIILYEQN
jgi:predicted nucleotidyltransferase